MIVRVLGALGIGALAMYFFDPISGKRRREQVREQIDHAGREIGGQRRRTSSVDIDLSQPQP